MTMNSCRPPHSKELKCCRHSSPGSGICQHSAGVFGGVAVYTMHDIHFTVVGYVWLGVWYTFAVFEMVYVKKVVDTVEMTTWSRTYYQVPFSTANLFRVAWLSNEGIGSLSAHAVTVTA